MGLYKTFHYARSEMGRAILEAGQFAHVPEADVWATLDELEWPCREYVTVSFQHGHQSKEPGFYSQQTLMAFAARFGTLCPVCLTPVGLEKRSALWADVEYMPTWLSYEGDSEFPVMAITEEPEWYTEAWQSRYWPGYGTRGRGHARCGIVDRVANWLTSGDCADSDCLNSVSYFFRRRAGGFNDYLNWLRDRPHLPLRFNPRTRRERRPYRDMRDLVDSRFELAFQPPNPLQGITTPYAL